MNIKTLIVGTILCLTAFTVIGQSANINPDGTWEVIIPSVTAKDAAYKAITLVVKEGVKSKAPSIVNVNTFETEVIYNKSTKMYSVTIEGTTTLETTTVSAVRNHVVAYFYKSVTGKSLNQ